MLTTAFCRLWRSARSSRGNHRGKLLCAAWEPVGKLLGTDPGTAWGTGSGRPELTAREKQEQSYSRREGKPGAEGDQSTGSAFTNRAQSLSWASRAGCSQAKAR